MLNRMTAALATVAVALAVSSAPAQVTLTRIARGGDPYPGRPGVRYGTNPDFGPFDNRGIDANGDVYFSPRDADGTANLLVYRSSSGAIETLARDSDSVPGLPFAGTLHSIWYPISADTPGRVVHVTPIIDPGFGDRLAVVVSEAGKPHRVLAFMGDTPPSHVLPAAFDSPGQSSSLALHANINDAGWVSFGATFLDEDGQTKFGYFLAEPGSDPVQMVDSTTPVPEHPGATWLEYDNAPFPFDPGGAGLDRFGNAYFRGKYLLGGTEHRAMYRRALDGSLTPLVDAGDGRQIPNAPAGSSYGWFKQALNNSAGDVAIMAEVFGPTGVFLGTGVYQRRAGGDLTRIIDWSTNVPGLNSISRLNIHNLAAMNDQGHIVVSTAHGIFASPNNIFGYSLLLIHDGAIKLVTRFDHLPGIAPPVYGTQLGFAAINNHDDIFFGATLSNGRVAFFAYLSDTDTVIPILKTGDMLDGSTVTGISSRIISTPDPAAHSGNSGGGLQWNDRRQTPLGVTLQSATGSLVPALYLVQLPPPACPCTADFDRSGGTPDSTDIDAFFSAWLSGSPITDADCSGGTPDSQDIAVFFAGWLLGGC